MGVTREKEKEGDRERKNKKSKREGREGGEKMQKKTEMERYRDRPVERRRRKFQTKVNLRVSAI